MKRQKIKKVLMSIYYRQRRERKKLLNCSLKISENIKNE